MYTLLHISCKNKQVESKSKKFLITEKKQPLNFNTFCKLQTPANGIHSQSLSISYQSQVSLCLLKLVKGPCVAYPQQSTLYVYVNIHNM